MTNTSDRRDDQYDGLIAEIADEMPPVPQARELDRVQRAVSRKRRNATRTPMLRWGLVASAAAVMVAVVIVASISGDGTAAFATERAIAALAPQGRVLHFAWEFDADESADPDGVSNDHALEGWVDRDRGLVREEQRDLESRDLVGVSLLADGRSHSLTRMTYTLGDGSETQAWAYVPPGRVEPEGVPSGLYWMEDLRAALVDGDATVEGTEVRDGAEYWNVTWRYVFEDGDVSVAKALLAVDDYRPLECSIRMETPAEPSYARHFVVTTWEVLDRSDVDPALFDPEALRALDEAPY